MADSILRQRTKRQGDVPNGGRNTNGSALGSGGTSAAAPVKTRRRAKDRLNGDAGVVHDVIDDVLEEGQSESVWLDGPLALTLLPPLGSFLTGGDFIRDGLILALLFYYLRALIKTPWELYLKARARRPPPSLQLEPNEDEVEPEYVASVRALARSELRLAEIAYLTLCLLTPFLGVLLLQYGAALLGADKSLTWFSTGLFVLSTGLRPWRHLIQLLILRTDSLHDIVHHPPILNRNKDLTSRESIALGLERFNAIEAELADLRDVQDQLSAQTQEDHSTIATLTSELSAAQSQLSHRDTSSSSASAEVRTILARVEESVEHLEAQIRNTSRAGELIRLDGEEKYAGVQDGIEGLIKEVGELHQRVATAVTTAAAAHSAASAAQAQAANALNSVGNGNGNGSPRSPTTRKASLALNMNGNGGLDSRDVSPSSRRQQTRRSSLSNSPPQTHKHLLLPQLFTPNSLGDKLLHGLVHALLVPIKLCQDLLHKVIGILGVAATPSTPLPPPKVFSPRDEKSTLLSPTAKGKGKAF